MQNQNPRQNIGAIAFAARGWFWFTLTVQNKKRGSILKYGFYPEVPLLVGSSLKPLKSPHYTERIPLMLIILFPVGYRLYNISKFKKKRN